MFCYPCQSKESQRIQLKMKSNLFLATVSCEVMRKISLMTFSKKIGRCQICIIVWIIILGSLNKWYIYIWFAAIFIAANQIVFQAWTQIFQSFCCLRSANYVKFTNVCVWKHVIVKNVYKWVRLIMANQCLSQKRQFMEWKHINSPDTVVGKEAAYSLLGHKRTRHYRFP